MSERTRVCEQCHREFVQTNCGGGRRKARFCSQVCITAFCRQAALDNPKNQKGEANHNWRGGISKNKSHYTRLFVERHPEKRRAQLALRHAVRVGKIVRPLTCSACAKPCKPHGHHDNYRKPLSVRWLCQQCHIQHHAALTRKRKAA